MKKERKVYTEQFKRDLVKYHHSSGKTIKEISLESNVSESCISNWTRTPRFIKELEGQKYPDNYSDMEKEVYKLKNQLINKENELIAKDIELKEKDNQIIHKADEIHILKRAIRILYD